MRLDFLQWESSVKKNDPTDQKDSNAGFSDISRGNIETLKDPFPFILPQGGA